MLRENDGTFRCIVEARDCTPEQAAVTEVNTGTYVFHVPALLRVLDQLNNNNAQGELYLTDVPALLKAQGLRVGLCDTCAPDEMLGVNTVEQLRQVEPAAPCPGLTDLFSPAASVIMACIFPFSPRAGE